MAVFLALALLLAQQTAEPPATFESLLKKMASSTADPCDGPIEDLSKLEDDLFWTADEVIAKGLNAPSAAPPVTRVTEALKKLERLGAEINKNWPEENRFHFEVMEISPALLVKMTFRTRGSFSVFGVPKASSGDKPSTVWRKIDVFDDHRDYSSRWRESLELFSLHRGPANKPRFLASLVGGSCAGSWGVSYYAHEWDPDDFGALAHELIKIDGAGGLGGESFGKLRTSGTLITLPYCWFSAIDTWDNPTLCAVDSYDLSGDRVRFAGTVVNRPDLLTIAKAIQYAQARDYQAVLAYCGSPSVARRMVSDIPPFVSGAVRFDVRRMSPLRERVKLGEEPALQFDIEKRGERWLVVAFRTD